MSVTCGTYLNRNHLGGLRCVVMALVAFCLLAYPVLPAYAGDDFADEVKIGKEASEQVAKESKFIEDPALVARVETMGQAIAKIATEKQITATYGKADVAKFNYTFKIIDDKAVNAFSLPGGFIYINKGLLEYAQSDDELAGVIAHEIAHSAHHHGMELMKTQNKAMMAVAGGLLAAAVLGANTEDIGSLAYLGNLINISKMSGYGQRAEYDADRTAVIYMAGTTYKPVGMLTFMERMARDEDRKPEFNYGIFRDHPESVKRAKEIVNQLQSMGIPLDRRHVTNYMKVEVKPVKDSTAQSVWIANTEIVRLADVSGETAAARAKKVEVELSTMLFAGASLHDVKIGGGGQWVTMRGKVVVAPTKEDAELAGTSIDKVVASAQYAIRKALFNERIQ